MMRTCKGYLSIFRRLATSSALQLSCNKLQSTRNHHDEERQRPCFSTACSSDKFRVFYVYALFVNLAMGNLPIIHRQIPPIHRSGCRDQGVESSDNRQMIYRNRQITPFLRCPSVPANHQLIVNRFPVIVNFAASDLSTIHQQNAQIHGTGDRALQGLGML